MPYISTQQRGRDRHQDLESCLRLFHGLGQLLHFPGKDAPDACRGMSRYKDPEEILQWFCQQVFVDVGRDAHCTQQIIHRWPIPSSDCAWCISYFWIHKVCIPESRVRLGCRGRSSVLNHIWSLRIHTVMKYCIGSSVILLLHRAWGPWWIVMVIEPALMPKALLLWSWNPNGSWMRWRKWWDVLECCSSLLRKTMQLDEDLKSQELPLAWLTNSWNHGLWWLIFMLHPGYSRIWLYSAYDTIVFDGIHVGHTV